MNRISKKLRSQTGASMLIALLFLMFCLFVGGSVLAAAGDNGARAVRISDQQEFLSLRCAAGLMADELDGGKAVDTLTLLVEDLLLVPSGESVSGRQRIITFRAPFRAGNPMTGMQRLLYETAVCRYLLEQDIPVEDTGVQVILEGFWYRGDPITTVQDFWYHYCPGDPQIGGSLDISGELDATGETFGTGSARFQLDTGENCYDFLVIFDTSRMTVHADATVSTTGIPHPPESQELESGDFVEITVTETRTYITWSWVNIRKGGERP